MKTPILFLTAALGILLWGCESLVTDYKLDTNPDFLSTQTLLEYIDRGSDTTLTLYRDAIRYAGLEEVFAAGDQTRIVPTNSAIRTILLSAGVTQLQDLSPNVVKGLFGYFSIPGIFRSTDLEADQTVGDLTITGDSLYLTRKIAGSDRYRLYVNDIAWLASLPITVIRQDYLFKDGAAHVVDIFPVYQPIIPATDPVPDSVDYSAAQKDTLWIAEDSNVYFGGKNNNYNTKVHQLVARANQFRYTFFKFNLKPVDFIQNLASAKLSVFVNSIKGSNYLPVCGVYDTSTDWDETTLTWNNKPEFGQEVTQFELFAGWSTSPVTQYILNAYELDKRVISLGLQALNGAEITSSSVQIRNSEYNNGVEQPYISLMSAIASELQLVGISPVKVKSNGMTTLSKENVSFTGNSDTYNYSDNNIIYVLLELPTQGTLTRFGLPLVKNGQFTQEELAAGAIRYIHNGAGNSDLFVLKAQDYIGGVVENRITMNVNIE